MQAAEMRAAESRAADMPMKTTVSAATADTPQDFRSKWQSAMSNTEENPVQHTAVGSSARTEINAAAALKNQNGAAGTPQAATADKASVSAAALRLADPSGSKVGESKEQPNLLATPAGQQSKRDGKAARVGDTAGVTAADQKPQSGSSDGATAGPQEIVVPIAPESIASLPPDKGQASGRTLNAARPYSSPTQSDSRKSEKAQAAPPALTGVTASSTGSSSQKAFSDLSTRHSEQCCGTASMPAGFQVSANAAAASSTAGSHANLTALPDDGSRTGLAADPSAPMARLSVRLDHAVAAQVTGVGDQQIVAAGPSHLDVGVFDSTHGWLRIRAELDPGGTVNASLTASAFAHPSLKSALPEMTSYLSSEAIGVSKIAIHRLDSSHGAALGQNKEGGAAFANGNQSGHGSQAQKQRFVAKESSGVQSDAQTAIGPFWRGGVLAGMSGGWLNVCA